MHLIWGSSNRGGEVGKLTVLCCNVFLHCCEGIGRQVLLVERTLGFLPLLIFPYEPANMATHPISAG